MSYELRNDDVLQVGFGSAHQAYRLREKTAWEWFKEADKPFAKYNYPCTLVTLSDGIEYWPEWVEYIKKNLHRYKIELHGSGHHYYKQMTKEAALADLRIAKDKLENEFQVKVTTWYVPYGSRRYPEWGEEVCKELGINFDVVGRDTHQHTFHYWHQEQIDKVKKIIEEICQNTGKNL